MKSPTLEAEHAIDDTSPLKLYDCLIPKLKEHRRFKIFKDSVFSIEDFREIKKIREIEFSLNKSRLPKVLRENIELEDKV